MNSYKLLTPGPLTTTDTVKQVMLFDHCTWDDDYKQITQTIRRTLLALGHVSEPEYTAVLMQGSGTFGVESVLTSVIGREDKLLIAANGAYGIAAGQCLAYAHDVRFYSGMFPGKQLSGASEARRYFIEDKQQTVFAA